MRGEVMLPAPVVHASLEAFRGPIPHPQALREYEEVMPGLAERIVRWTEDEAGHRRQVESSLMQLSWGGLWSAFLLAMTAILGGMVLALNGRSAAGLAGIVGALSGLVIVFVAGQRSVAPDTTETRGKTPLAG